MASILTHPEWNQETGGLEIARAFADHIRGKNVLITGVSPESIGSAIALSFASQSPNLLIFASRTQSKLEEVSSSILESCSGVSIKTILLDLMSQASIKEAAAGIAKLTDRLDFIINNAAFMSQTRRTTEEGIEGQFGAHHIGHFLLTKLLMPQLLVAARSNPPGFTRVINLTSDGHALSPVRFSDYNITGKEVPPEEMHRPLPPFFADTKEDGYNGWVSYGQGKTANILFSIGFNDKFEEEGISSYAVHPGSIWTGLSRNLDAAGEATIRKTSTFWKNHDQGASTVMVAALDPALRPSRGVYLGDCQMSKAQPHAMDPVLAKRLWKLSEALIEANSSEARDS